jgi:hypothetical protein
MSDDALIKAAGEGLEFIVEEADLRVDLLGAVTERHADERELMARRHQEEREEMKCRTTF